MSFCRDDSDKPGMMAMVGLTWAMSVALTYTVSNIQGKGNAFGFCFESVLKLCYLDGVVGPLQLDVPALVVEAHDGPV